MVNNNYDALFDYAGQKYDVDPALLRTIFRNESSENPDSVDSSAGAQGGMQMLPDTARTYGAPNPRDMRMAIPAAAIYIRKALDSYGTPEGALAAYHGGFDTSQWGPKTMAYVEKGIKNYAQVKSDMAKAAGNYTPMAASMPQSTDSPIDPDVEAGKAFLNGSMTNQPAPVANDPDVEAGAKLLSQFQTSQNAQTQAPFIDKNGKPVPPTTASDAYQYIPPGSLNNLPQPTMADKLMSAGTQIGQAMREGYDNTPVPLNLLGGPYRGAQEALVQMGVPKDIVSVLDAYAGSPNALITPRSYIPSLTKSPALVPLADNAPATVGGGYLSGAPMPEIAASEAPKMAPAAPEPPAAPIPSEPSQAAPVAPTDSTVGAAQYSGPAQQMSQAEAEARQAAAEGSQLEQSDSDRRAGGILFEPQSPIPGVQRTLGTIDLNHAAEEGALRDMFPTEFKNVDIANNGARVDYLEQGIPDDIAVYNLKQARYEKAQTDLAPMKSNPQPVKLQPVVDLINQQLSEGAADRGLVANTLNSVKNTLMDNDGNLRTDPNRIYNGARKNITDMLERAKADPASNEATANENLMAIKNALDDQIADANPTFETYRNNYATASGPIDEAILMGQLAKKVTNAQGVMQLSRVDTVLNNLDKARNDSAGANQAKHVTSDTMQRLFDLRNDLQADSARDDMIRTVGSNTHTKILQGQKYLVPPSTPLRNALGNAGEVALHGVASYLDPTSVAGNALIRYGADALKNRRAAMTAQQADAMNQAQQAAQRTRLQQFLNPTIPPQ